ncbi:glycosyl hydrolase family 18 protein [Bacillus norwichensis]|uniref:LysM peptidoglycan-binding domain-containing protein n=1 Tax=Bacillus norwichensis TaxID=2762217 RepID=A0ABR8VHY7_9BACI|nr:glycosyl hydrolase family 18 protein [Bacillus norwichensis]MBD8004377.1 LysM peptidoglycan-binding domain-containing protein [Bacillus norwichensis]
MFIYVVKLGDSLFSIAAKYRISMDSLRITNGLRTDQLVPGQDLLVPSNVYIVQPGDSLYSISQIAFIPEETIRLYNGLQSDELTVGMELYFPPREKHPKQGLSYLTPSTPEQNRLNVQTFAPITSNFGVFEYHILEDGSLSALDDQQVISLIRENGAIPIVVITNLTESGFSPQLTNRILNNPSLRQRVIDNIYNLVKSKNYAGVNIDFEQTLESDRDLYSGFLAALRDRLRPEGLTVSVAVPAKSSDDIPWLKGFDYGGIGAAVDFVFIMAYDWHEAGSDPGPVAPITEVRKTLDYALTKMRRDKIVLGVPRYGYNWTMNNGSVVSARAFSVANAYATAMRYQVSIEYSTEDQQPHYTYWDEDGRRHIVWFEDIRARAVKFQLAVDYQLRGVGAWQLGLHFPQSAFLVREFFRKRR